MKTILFATLCFLHLTTFAQVGPYSLWYKQPAQQWEEALPVGNGRLGAMVFGGVEKERIQFNEETLWTGRPRSYAHKGAHQYLGQIRQLLNEGKQKEAEQLAGEHFMSDPLRQMAYQAFGDLYIETTGQPDVTDYKRELNLQEGIVRVAYRAKGVGYSREVFASHPASLIYVQLTADQKGKLDFALGMDALHETKSVVLGQNEMTLKVKVSDGALEGVARVRVLSDGKVTKAGSKLHVSGATYATLVLAAATNFANYADVSGNPEQKVTAVLAKAPVFSKARSQHVTDHSALFNRFSMELPATEASALPTDRRLKSFKDRPDDPALLGLYVQFARYLTIAGSRPGTQATNLQGIWNHQLKPSWDSKYTVNINTEMNYWPVEMTNLSECHEPLFDLIRDVSRTGAEVAKEHYAAKGWVLHHNTDLWRGAAPINAANHGIWVTGGAWLSLHLWEHYRFTQDKKFLAEKAYPLMKGAAEFFLGFLVEEPGTGLLISSPSNSPENGGLVAGPTMDHQIIRGLFRACIEGERILGNDPEFRKKLEVIIPKIAPNEIGQYGQLKEWRKDLDDTTSHHRHVSHLWGVFPGEEIRPDITPELMKAAMQSLRYRGDDGTGWSLAWKINYWARFRDGEHAYTMVRKLFNPVVVQGEKMSGGGSYPNLFDAHPPFQIDGNFGGAAGILEMLVQSHAGELHIFPALPSALPTGSITGLCARGGFELSLKWKEGKLVSLAVLSKAGGKCNVRYAGKTISFDTVKGKTYQLNEYLQLQ